MAMDYKYDLHDLKRSFRPGKLFSISDVQRKMFWGYNRARNTIDTAIEKKEAEEVKTDRQQIKYQFI